MKTLTIASCMLIGVVALEAQITAVLRHLPQGLDEVRLRNESTKVLVAYAMTVEQFKRMADSVRPWYVPAEQQLAVDVYQPIIGRTHQPAAERTGSAFPSNSIRRERNSCP